MLTLLLSSLTSATPIGLNFIDKERPLVGQAPYVINAGLTHSFIDNKYSINALYNKVGRRLAIASGVILPSVWEAPRNVVDLQMSMKLLKNKGELRLNAGDILNNGTTFYYDLNKNGKYDAADETQSNYKPGSNYSFTFAYTF